MAYGSPEIAITTVQSLLIILNIAGNSLVCVIIMKNRDMRTSINFLLVNLAVADMSMAIFFVPPYMLIHTFTHPQGVSGTVLCRLLTGGVLAWVGAGASVFTLVVIAVERYYAVLHPLGNKGKLSYRKLKVIIPCSWIFGVIINIPAFLFMKFDKEAHCIMMWPERWMGKAYFLAWCLLLAFLPVALMVVLYSRVVYALWFKRAVTDNHKNRQQAVMKVRKRVTLIVITVSVIFGVCWLVDSINYVMYYYFPSRAFLSYAGSSVMLLFNSAINPIVYALVNQRFREKFKGMVKHRANNRIHLARKPRAAVVSTHPTLLTEENCLE